MGYYDKKGLWKNLYLGKAGYGRHSGLYKRLGEELWDERPLLWKSILDRQVILNIVNAHSPSWLNGTKRALEKGGTTHIIWVSTPELNDSQVHNVEADLIETLNPQANVIRPTSPSVLQPFTKEIIGRFRELIHHHRPERPIRRKKQISEQECAALMRFVWQPGEIEIISPKNDTEQRL